MEFIVFLVFILLILWVIFGGGDRNKNLNSAKAKESCDEKVHYFTIEIDDCEYIATRGYNGHVLTHKGNCKNCKTCK